MKIYCNLKMEIFSYLLSICTMSYCSLKLSCESAISAALATDNSTNRYRFDNIVVIRARFMTIVDCCCQRLYDDAANNSLGLTLIAVQANIACVVRDSAQHINNVHTVHDKSTRWYGTRLVLEKNPNSIL